MRISDVSSDVCSSDLTRTFSKMYGLAAERIGWGYASAEVIDALHRIRAPFNVTTAGQAAAVAAIADTQWVDESRAHNRKWREWLAGEVEAMGNLLRLFWTEWVTPLPVLPPKLAAAWPRSAEDSPLHNTRI